MNTCKWFLLTHFILTHFISVCPKWAKIQKQHTQTQSVVLLIVCGSALRTIDLIKWVSVVLFWIIQFVFPSVRLFLSLLLRHLIAFKGQAKVLKLFAKHIKVDDQIKSLSKGVTHIAVGTPGRIATLLEKGLFWCTFIVNVILTNLHGFQFCEMYFFAPLFLCFRGFDCARTEVSGTGLELPRPEAQENGGYTRGSTDMLFYRTDMFVTTLQRYFLKNYNIKYWYLM